VWWVCPWCVSTLAGIAETTDIERVEGVPESLWERIRAQPDRAPEFIALAAAERFGPAAERWVQIAGPGHSPEKLARIAYKKHVRIARLEGAALGLGGAVTAAFDIVALLWIQSRMVFYIAAAYGYDPKHPMRPAELLVLQDVYPTAHEARQALDGAGGARLPFALAQRALRGGTGSPGVGRRLAQYGGERIARRYGGRLVPLIGAPIGAVQNAAATRELGRKALAYYGGPQARP
jgi:EcsC protein family